MKQMITLICSVLVFSGLQAQNAASGANTTVTEAVTKDLKTNVVTIEEADKMLTLNETEHDFGKIPQGKPVTTIFEVANMSKTPLKIANINASCGCTTPEWEKDKTIAPGEKTKITVGYNAAAEGPFTKFITVSYNETQTKQLIIKGEVWKTPGSSAPENKGLNDLKN
ncbi:MAG: DUF1573 domain-containing protein [Chitinophagaceae bacterium]|nr:DUF1573 domain-containing protein [Chitinophagaceae bacterium]